MKTLLTLLILCLVNSLAFSQITADSVQQKIEQFQLPEMPDSLKTTWSKVDFIRTDFNTQADSLKNEYQQAIGEIDQQQSKIQHSIDSLNNLKLPSNKLTRKLDSLNQERQKVTGDLNSKVDKLKEKTIGKLSKIEMTPEMQGPVGEFTQKINGFNVTNNDFVKLPPLEIPGYSLPKIDGVNTSGIQGLGDIANIETPLGNLSDVTKQAEGLGGDIKNISQGNLNDVQQIPQTIEQQAGKIDGIQELQKQSAVVDGYKEQLGVLGDPDAMKKQGADMVKKEAINHFAGKDKQLKEAMNQLSKYKQKYSSVSSIKDLPKRPPNAMKGKPFVERLVPGMFLQFQLKNAWLLDVNPYAGYKISGRFTAGLGWNQRFAYEKRAKQFEPHLRIYGPRVFLDAGLGKGFIAHLEQEVMNTYVPARFKRTQDAGVREWVWSTMLGMKKTYKIYKNLNGTVLIQYNLFNPFYKAPYIDRLNSRMGFEYVLKKKKCAKTEVKM